MLAYSCAYDRRLGGDTLGVVDGRAFRVAGADREERGCGCAVSVSVSVSTPAAAPAPKPPLLEAIGVVEPEALEAFKRLHFMRLRNGVETCARIGEVSCECVEGGLVDVLCALSLKGTGDGR